MSFSVFEISSWVCGLTLVDTWRFSKSTWSLDRQVIWKSRWGPPYPNSKPYQVNGHWRCETGGALFCEYKVITWWMNHVTRWLWSIQLKPHLPKISGYCASEGGDKVFCLHITWSYDQWVTWLGGWDTLTLNHKGYYKNNRTN